MPHRTPSPPRQRQRQSLPVVLKYARKYPPPPRASLVPPACSNHAAVSPPKTPRSHPSSALAPTPPPSGCDRNSQYTETTHEVFVYRLPQQPPAHPSAQLLGRHCSIASASPRNNVPKASNRTTYETVRPDFAAATTPARSSVCRCRETTEKSTEQHSATSVTVHALPHLIRHPSSRARVGSHNALKSSGSNRSSSGPPHVAACFGVIARLGATAFRVRTCVMMQV